MQRAHIQIVALPVLFALGTAGPAPAQQFEGVVTIRTVRLTADIVSDQTGEEELSDRGREKLFALSLEQLVQISGSAHANVMQVKGGRTRTGSVEMPGLGAAYMLMDPARGMMRTVAPARRGYYEMSMRERPGAASQEEPEEAEITPLGRTQVINGMRCTGYRMIQGDQVTRVWTTGDAAAREMVTNQLRMVGEESEGARSSRALLARYGAPVLTQAFDEEGGYSFELWSFERKSLPDSLFVVPPGFTKLRTPGN